MSNKVPLNVGLNKQAVRRIYAKWAPYYDATFGMVVGAGRKQVVKLINEQAGKVLEVGVGTGISLPMYRKDSEITAIDLSPEMLKIARKRVDARGLTHVKAVEEMDASKLTFEDASFDTVVAMYVMTVVPDVDKVMSELERVCKPGGQVILVNHFSAQEGIRAEIEEFLEPFADRLGWHPDFDIERLMGRQRLNLIESRRIRPFGLFTLLRFSRCAVPQTSDTASEPITDSTQNGVKVAISKA